GSERFPELSYLLYHTAIASPILHATTCSAPDHIRTPTAPLIPLHLSLHNLFDAHQAKTADIVESRRLVLGNDDVRISYVVAGTPSKLYRNGIGDECVYIESGTARLETVFGTLDVGRGDYTVIPRATTHRWTPTGHTPVRAYIIEASSHITPPQRYLSRYGQFLEHSPYCERDLRGPTEPLLVE